MSATSRATPTLLRDLNERTVLETIRAGAPISRAEISRRSGISKPTVSLALESLLQADLVREATERPDGPGYGAVYFEPVAEAAVVLGLDLGARFVRGAVCDLAGEVRARQDVELTVAEVAEAVEAIERLRTSLLETSGLDRNRIDGVVVGVPGVVEQGTGLLRLAENVAGLEGRAFATELQSALDLPVRLENDVNLAALGEQALGAGRGVSDFCFLWIGTGVGLGIVIGGELHRGVGGAAGEIGYLPLGAGDPHDRAVRRRGLFEESASGAAVMRAARDAGLVARTPKAVFAAARRGQPAALAAVDVEAARIALAIAAVVPVLDPELVILGGGIARGGGDLLLGPVARELEELSPFRPRLAVTELGDEAVLHGAVSVALAAAREEMFDRTRDLERREIVA